MALGIFNECRDSSTVFLLPSKRPFRLVFQLKNFKSMKKNAIACLALAAFALFLPAFSIAPPPDATPLKWYTWEEAVALSQTKPKKIIVDVYTDWCGWCKKMDKSTFADPTVMAYISEHFYPVKLNAEQREEILFNGESFKFVANDNGRGGVHTLAYALLDGRMGYPAMVYLNEKYERIMISPGYKESPDMLKELRFAAEEQYAKMSWEQYKNGK
jgi:thioredoxin-related protein